MIRQRKKNPQLDLAYSIFFGIFDSTNMLQDILSRVFYQDDKSIMRKVYFEP